MKEKFIVAFDQGTTSTRAIIFNEQGNVVAISQKELTQHYPKSGWVEHDPMQIYQDQLATFEDVVKKAKIEVHQIVSIGITNQRETTVVWDKITGKPIYNAIVWLDKRSIDICEDLKNKGFSEYVKENTGLVVDPYFSGTKLKWILENVTGAKEKAEKNELLFGTVDSWLIYKFTNGKKHVTDYTNASRTMVFNIKTLTWDATLLEALDLPKSVFPSVQSSSSDFGEIEFQNSKIPIYGVAGDQQASLFGQGGIQSRMAKNTYGTGCFILLNTGDKFVKSTNGLLTTLACSLDSEPQNYALEGSVFVGGASIQWLRDKMKIIDSAVETEEICTKIPPLNDVYVVPAFAGLGAPHWDENAKGSIYGMTLDTGKEELIKATVEAMAYQTKDVLNAMIEDSKKEIISLKVDGGASANNYLMQFQSDILNIEVDRPKMLEVTAFGAALLAGIKSGVWTKKDIASIRKTDTLFTSEMTQKERNKKYKGWQEAVNKTKSTSNCEFEKKPFRFSILDRNDQKKHVKSSNFDLLIIGGGVTGAGIALDASARGMNVCLIEKNDFASGTSNKSTKLIHGGLRYLKQMEISLVKESGLERAIVHELAPHLVVPEKMLLPLIEDGNYGKILTSIGLKVYDILANVEGEDKRKMLDATETLSKEPLLDKKEVLGSGFYAEYRTDDARLAIELLKKSTDFGATILNYCEMTSFNYDKNGKISSTNIEDSLTKEAFKISAKKYVSATGPWVDTIRKKDNSINHKYLYLTKGVHLVFPFKKLPVQQSIYFDVEDGRMIFAIPRGKITYLGTTDTKYSGDLNRIVVTKKDVNYLLEAVNKTFPTVKLTQNDVQSCWAGLRPLIYEEGKDPSELSRKDEIFVSESGLISIAGGKLTGYRKMAERVLSVVLKTMNPKIRSQFEASNTAEIPLVTPILETSKKIENYQKELKKALEKFGKVSNYIPEYLCTTYGKNADKIVQKASFFNHGTIEERVIRAELWYGIQYEMTTSLADFFVRRTGRMYFDIESVQKYKSLILEDFVQYFGWDTEKITQEKVCLKQLIQDATTFYKTEFD